MCLDLNTLNQKTPTVSRTYYKIYRVNDDDRLLWDAAKLHEIDLKKGMDVASPFQGNRMTLQSGLEIVSDRSQYTHGETLINGLNYEERRKHSVSYGIHVCNRVNKLVELAHDCFADDEVVIVAVECKPENFVAVGSFVDISGHAVYSAVTPLRIVKHFFGDRKKRRNN